MLKSLPVQDPERLVLFHWHADTWPRSLSNSGSGGPSNPAYQATSRSQAYPFFRELQQQSDLFESVFAFAPLGSDRRNVTLSADNGAEPRGRRNGVGRKGVEAGLEREALWRSEIPVRCWL